MTQLNAQQRHSMLLKLLSLMTSLLSPFLKMIGNSIALKPLSCCNVETGSPFSHTFSQSSKPRRSITFLSSRDEITVLA